MMHGESDIEALRTTQSHLGPVGSHMARQKPVLCNIAYSLLRGWADEQFAIRYCRILLVRPKYNYADV